MPCNLFLIRGRQSGMVLDVQASGTDPGTNVVLWEETGNDNQLWYYDHIEDTIRSKLNDMCLDFDDEDTLVINPYEGRKRQQWKIDDDMIKNGKGKHKVVDVAGHATDAGSRVCVWDEEGSDNQRFDLEYIHPPRFFFVVSELSGRVLDIRGGDATPGADLIVYERTGNDNQLFMHDKQGWMRSKLGRLALESDKKEKGIEMAEKEGGSAASQAWTFSDGKIVNIKKNKRLLEILDGADEDGAEVVWNNKDDGEPHQRWRLEYE